MARDSKSVRENEWRARCDDERAVSTAQTDDSRERAFRRAYADLKNAKMVTATGGQVFLSDKGRGVAGAGQSSGGELFEADQPGQTGLSGGKGMDGSGSQRNGCAGKPGQTPDKRNVAEFLGRTKRTNTGQSGFARGQSPTCLRTDRTGP